MITSLLLTGLLAASNVVIEGGGTMVEEKAVKQPIVLFVGKIDEEAAKEFVAGMYAAQDTGQTIIPIIISSYGGSVYALIQMIDAIKASKVKVATIAIGKAMSAGAVLLAMGAPGMRYAAPNATIMIHEVSSSAGGKLGDMISDTTEATRLNALMFKLMAQSIGKPADFFTNLIASKGRADWYLTAEEAVGIGLVNKIGTPEIKVRIKVETTLEQ